MIYILIIEFLLISVTGLIQEFILPGIGSLIVTMFSLLFLGYAILEKANVKGLPDRDLQ